MDQAHRAAVGPHGSAVGFTAISHRSGDMSWALNVRPSTRTVAAMSTAAPTYQPATIPPDAAVAVVAARFNATLVDELLAGCVRRLADAGMTGSRVTVHRVPGAFELPVTAKVLADTGKFAAVVCLGAVVRGDTPHFDFVAGEAARGCMAVSIATGVPVIFGVLTTNTEQQAWDRTGGPHGHAGERAAEAAVEMIAVLGAARSA